MLPVGIRHFERNRDLQILFCWRQEGRRIWTDEDEVNAQNGLDSHNRLPHFWIRDRLTEVPPELSARLSVLIQSDVSGRSERGERLVNDFTRQFARELYKTCPWALPIADASTAMEK